MNDDIELTLTSQEVDFLATVLSQLPYGTVLQAGMAHLLPKIGQQAQAKNIPAGEPA